MDIKDEILKIYNDPSSYNSVKFHELFMSYPSVAMLGISNAIEDNNNKRVSEEVKRCMLIDEWNGFMNDLNEDEVIKEYRRWRDFCKWSDSFDWCKDFDLEKCVYFYRPSQLLSSIF